MSDHFDPYGPNTGFGQTAWGTGIREQKERHGAEMQKIKESSAKISRAHQARIQRNQTAHAPAPAALQPYKNVGGRLLEFAIIAAVVVGCGAWVNSFVLDRLDSPIRNLSSSCYPLAMSGSGFCACIVDAVKTNPFLLMRSRGWLRCSLLIHLSNLGKGIRDEVDSYLGATEVTVFT